MGGYFIFIITLVCSIYIYIYNIYIIFSHLADAFIQNDLQMRTTEAINCSIKSTKTDPKLKAKML